MELTVTVARIRRWIVHTLPIMVHVVPLAAQDSIIHTIQRLSMSRMVAIVLFEMDNSRGMQEIVILE